VRLASHRHGTGSAGQHAGETLELAEWRIWVNRRCSQPASRCREYKAAMGHGTEARQSAGLWTAPNRLPSNPTDSDQVLALTERSVCAPVLEGHLSP